jgi:hypothetical protein
MSVPLISLEDPAHQFWPRAITVVELAALYGLCVHGNGETPSGQRSGSLPKGATHVSLARLYGLTRPAHRCALHPGPFADRPTATDSASAGMTPRRSQGVFRSIEPAWNDQNLRELAGARALAAVLRAHPRGDRVGRPADELPPVPVRPLARGCSGTPARVSRGRCSSAATSARSGSWLRTGRSCARHPMTRGWWSPSRSVICPLPGSRCPMPATEWSAREATSSCPSPPSPRKRPYRRSGPAWR